jgi:Tol biopolymer transport system component
VAKRGYRFIAPLAGNGASAAALAPPATEPVGSAPGGHAGPSAARSRRRRTAIAAAGALAAAGARAALVAIPARRSPGRGGDEPVLEPRRITSGRDKYGSPAVSPDGHAVAYTSARTGSSEIYVASLAPGSRELQVTSDGGRNFQPVFSPDGQWLAYVSEARQGIWVVPSTGGPPRRVSAFGSQPSWAPDSKTLVFSSLGSLSSQALLWTVRLDGSQPEPLTTLGSPPGGHLHPSWSHDGRFVAFRVGRHRTNEAWIVERDGSAPRRVATLTRYSDVCFAPDDRGLYFFGRTAENNDSLMRVGLDARGRAAGEPERVLTFQGEGVQRLTIARDGTAVFQWNRWSANLWAIDPNRTDAEPRQLTFDEDVVNAYADFARDGRIAFQQAVAGRPVTAWVTDAEGGHGQPASAGLAVSVRYPQWDARGERLFVAAEPASPEAPYFGWLELATRQLARIPVRAGSDSVPRLSPDGGQLAYHQVAADGTLNLWVRGLDGGPARQLTFDAEAMSYPVWSPDGRWLGLQVKRGEDSQVGVVAAAGGPVEVLTRGRGVRWAGGFSPDGEWLAFTAVLDGGETWNVHAVSRSTKRVRQLTHFRSGPGAKYPAWSRTGDRLVFTVGSGTSSIWSVTLPTSFD